MNCIEVKEIFNSLIDGEINFSENEKTTDHLENCGSCQTELEGLQRIRKTMKRVLPVSAPGSLDEKVLNAFQVHHSKTQSIEIIEKKEETSWFGVPKLAFAAALLLLALFSGSAFQLGRISVSNSGTPTFPDEGNDYSSSADRSGVKNASIKSNDIGSNKTKIVEVPVVKIVKIPVIKPKIVTRVIYRNRYILKQGSTNAPANRNPETEKTIETRRFQIVSKLKPKILKKGESDEE